jgi:hypothetical protein
MKGLMTQPEARHKPGCGPAATGAGKAVDAGTAPPGAPLRAFCQCRYGRPGGWGTTMRLAGIIIVAAWLMLASAVQARELFAPAIDAESYSQSPVEETARQFGLSEVRIGPAMSNLELSLVQVVPGMHFFPDPDSFQKGRLDSVEFEALFGTPWPDVFKWIGSPRPSVGGLVNLAGYESLVHAGLDWHLPIGSTPFYLEAGVGLGTHNGYLTNPPPGYHELGCRFLVHYQYGAGMNLTPNVTLTLQWQHMSNILFGCGLNQGLNDLGLEVGWKF